MINPDKITEVIIKGKNGEFIARITPGMWETLTMKDKSKKLIIHQSKQ